MASNLSKAYATRQQRTYHLDNEITMHLKRVPKLEASMQKSP